jgi:hypothetical protein
MPLSEGSLSLIFPCLHLRQMGFGALETYRYLEAARFASALVKACVRYPLASLPFLLAAAGRPFSFLPSTLALRRADSSPQSEGGGTRQVLQLRRTLSLFDRSFAPFFILSMQPSTKDAKSRFTTFSLPAFSLQNICRAISACRLCAASLYSGLTPENALSSETTKVEKNTAIKTSKITRLKLLLLFLSFQSQLYQPTRDGFRP